MFWNLIGYLIVWLVLSGALGMTCAMHRSRMRQAAEADSDESRAAMSAAWYRDGHKVLVSHV